MVTPQFVDRQLLFWAIVVRRQLCRWENSVAEIVRLGFRSVPPPGQLVWLAEADRHFVFVGARNLLRAGQFDDQVRVEPRLAENLKIVRDLLEHWDQNMPVFNLSPRRETPAHKSGKTFAEWHPGKTPYSSFNWNSKEGPILAPEIPAQLLHESLDRVETFVLGRSPDLKDYLSDRAASPWLGEDAGKDRWWPKLSSSPTDHSETSAEASRS